MLQIFFIAFGGAIGSVARYGLSGWAQRISQSAVFPWGTLAVNLIGAFVIGIFWGITERFVLPVNIRLLFFIGFLGAFTTFSTFCLENLNLLRAGEMRLVLLNIGLSNILGLALVMTGFYLTTSVFQMLRS